MGSVVFFFTYFGSPKFTDVGYRPDQPIDYSHKLHAGELGMDCRYCHTSVEKSQEAVIPPTQTCMNCHSVVQTEKTAKITDFQKCAQPNLNANSQEQSIFFPLSSII